MPAQTAQTVNAIAIDPITPQNIYLAAPNGLFRSTDGGLKWETLTTPAKSTPLAVTLDPRNPTTLFVLLEDGALLRSADSGKTWATAVGVSP